MIQKLHHGKSMELQLTKKLPIKFIFSGRESKLPEILKHFPLVTFN